MKEVWNLFQEPCFRSWYLIFWPSFSIKIESPQCDICRAKVQSTVITFRSRLKCCASGDCYLPNPLLRTEKGKRNAVAGITEAPAPVEQNSECFYWEEGWGALYGRGRERVKMQLWKYWAVWVSSRKSHLPWWYISLRTRYSERKGTDMSWVSNVVICGNMLMMQCILREVFLKYFVTLMLTSCSCHSVCQRSLKWIFVLFFFAKALFTYL